MLVRLHSAAAAAEDTSSRINRAYRAADSGRENRTKRNKNKTVSLERHLVLRAEEEEEGDDGGGGDEDN